MVANVNEKVNVNDLDAVMKLAVYGRMAKGLVFQSLEFSKDRVVFGISQSAPNQLTELFNHGNEEEATFLFSEFRKGAKHGASHTATYEASGQFVPTRGYLALTCSDVDIAKELFSGILHFRPHGYNPLLVHERIEGNTVVLRDMITGKDYIGEQPSKDAGWKSYVFFKATPAEVRTDSCVMIDISDHIGELGNPFVMETINELTHGTLEILSERDMTVAKLIKGFARLALWGTYSRSAGYVRAYTIIKKFDQLGFSDGNFFARAGFISDWVYERTGVRIPEAQLVGYAFRARPGMAKGMAICIDNDMMWSLNRFYIDSEGYKKVGEGIPDFISDRNAWKEDIDWAKPMDFRILAPMARMRDASMNVQVLAKICTQESFDNIIKEGTQRLIDKAFWFAADDKEARRVGIEEFGPNAVASQLLMALCPDFAVKLGGVYNNAIEVATENACREAGRFHMPLDPEKSATLYLAPDFAVMFGQRLLANDEVYSGALPHDQQMIGIRVPSVHPGEFERVTGVGRNAMRDRIESLEIEGWQKRFLSKLYRGLNRNICAVPIDDRFKILGGGLDFDTDTMFFMWEDAILEAFKDVDQQAIDSEKPGYDDGSLYRMCHDTMVKAFVISISSGSNKIGIFVHALTRILEVYSAGIDARRALVEEMFGPAHILNTLDAKEVERELGADYDRDRSYKRRFVGDCYVKVAEADEALKDMRFRDTDDDDTVNNILLDLMVVLKTWIDRVIDAAKTSDRVEMKLDIASTIGADLFSIFTVDVDYVERKVKIRTIKDDKVDSFNNSKAVVVEGAMTKAKKYMLREIASKVAGLMRGFKGLEQKDANMLTHVTRYHDKGDNVLRSLWAVKQCYGDITGLRNSDLVQFSDAKSPQALAHTAWAKDFRAGLGDMIRMFAKAGDITRPSDVAALSFLSAISTSEGLDFKNTNNMPTVITGPEVLAMACRYHYIENELAMTKIFVSSDAEVNEGDVLKFTNGICAVDGELVASSRKRLNGEFTVKKENGVWFATAPIYDLIQNMLPAAGNRIVLRVKVGSMSEQQIKKLVEDLNRAKEFVFASGIYNRGEGDRLVHGDFSVPVVAEGSFMSKLLDGHQYQLVSVREGQVDVRGKKRNAMLILLEDTGVKVELPKAPVVSDDYEIEFDTSNELPL